jgi:hypothetical protein
MTRDTVAVQKFHTQVWISGTDMGLNLEILFMYRTCTAPTYRGLTKSWVVQLLRGSPPSSIKLTVLAVLLPFVTTVYMRLIVNNGDELPKNWTNTLVVLTSKFQMWFQYNLTLILHNHILVSKMVNSLACHVLLSMHLLEIALHEAWRSKSPLLQPVCWDFRGFKDCHHLLIQDRQY